MGEKQALLAIAFGFVAFSVPLLYQDTKHIWQAPPGSAFPPPPPEFPSYTYPEEDDKDAKFRRACTDGNLVEAEAVLKEFGHEVVTKAHWHGNTPIFEAARAGQLAMVRWLVEHGAKADEKNEWGDAPVNEVRCAAHPATTPLHRTHATAAGCRCPRRRRWVISTLCGSWRRRAPTSRRLTRTTPVEDTTPSSSRRCATARSKPCRSSRT